jgi:inhibitor of KinA
VAVSSKGDLSFLPLGDRALLLEAGNTADPETVSRVRALADYLAQLHLPGVLDLVPALCTIGIHYDPEQWRDGSAARSPYELLVEHIRTALPDPATLVSSEGHAREIPVCYEADCAADLPALARKLGLSRSQVIDIHSAVEYSVYMIGFAPGFAYLGPLDARLVLPRRKTPRTRVPAGSVAIANQYSGIYPGELPGGWHLIGRTPLRLFDPSRTQPSLLKAGDRVRFSPIDAAKFRRLQSEAQ